jgi:hypothetical protein
MNKKTLLALTAILFFTLSVNGQKSSINFPGGRIAFSSDGNQHDKDDWGATAMSLAMLHYAGLGDKLVHYDHSNHMGNNNARWEQKMIESAKGGATRFGLDTTIVFNAQTEAEKAIANFKKQAEMSSKSNPLWFICAGPMEMPYRALSAVKKSKLKYVYCISHSTWNEKHNDAENYHTWEDMKRDFPQVTFYNIIDQNSSDGVDDFNTPDYKWFWLKNSTNPNWQWLFAMDDKKGYDVSDAGMTWWLITGGPNGGDEKGGWPEMQALFTGAETLDTAYNNGIIIIEAESTASELGKWKLVKKGDENYVDGANGSTHIEFTGNGINGGAADSPLKYEFVAPADGVYQLLIRCRKRLEGTPGDKCNDGWIKLEGIFESGNDIPTNDLKNNEKFFGGNADTWGWGSQLDWKGHIKRDALYKLKKGEKYTITMSGRSIRWNVDNLVLFNTTNYTKQDVFSILDPSSVKKVEPINGWNTEVNGFVGCYFDKGRNAFAINTTEVPTDKWSAVNKRFDGENGSYTITFTSLCETDGECSYRLLVDGKVVISVTNPRIFGTDAKEYAPHKTTVKDIRLMKGSIIQVEFLSHSNGLIPEGNAFAYARGRWQEPIIVKQ